MQARRPEIAVRWRYFSLEQINNDQGPDWKVWEQPPEFDSRSLPAFAAAEAARRQGDDAFARLHLALLRARHELRRSFRTPATIDAAATEAGLDLDQLHRDLADPAILEPLARSHQEAVARYGVFGTPTLVWPEGQAAFMRMRPPPPPEETLAVFDSLRRLMVERTYVLELKRPKGPQPA